MNKEELFETKEELEYITISLKEYKELLIIKGKYEELKNNQPIPYIYPNKITWTNDKGEKIEYPYKITCGVYKSEE